MRKLWKWSYEKIVQLSQDYFGTPGCPLFFCFASENAHSCFPKAKATQVLLVNRITVLVLVSRIPTERAMFVLIYTVQRHRVSGQYIKWTATKCSLPTTVLFYTSLVVKVSHVCALQSIHLFSLERGQFHIYLTAQNAVSRIFALPTNTQMHSTITPQVIVSITKFLIVIGSLYVYLSINWHVIMWVSNYRNQIWTFCNWIPMWFTSRLHAI